MPQAGEVRVRLTHASLNHLDIWIRKGMPSVQKPRVMGADGAGVVDEIGDGVTSVTVGDAVLLDPSVTCGVCAQCVAGATVFCDTFMVLGEHCPGTHAGYITVPAVNVHAIPGHLSVSQAAALPLVFGTAWRMIMTRAQARPGERMLVWGASAGVGCAAIQLGSALGLEVIATSRSSDKLGILRELGAHHVIDTSATDVVTAVNEITNGGDIDIVFDHLGDVAWKPSMAVLARGGRYVTCGATTGPNPPAGITRMFWKQLSILGSTMATKHDVADMLRFVGQHHITPRVDREFSLEDIVAAHSYLESAGQVGKVVLTIDH